MSVIYHHALAVGVSGEFPSVVTIWHRLVSFHGLEGSDRSFCWLYSFASLSREKKTLLHPRLRIDKAHISFESHHRPFRERKSRSVTSPGSHHNPAAKCGGFNRRSNQNPIHPVSQQPSPSLSGHQFSKQAFSENPLYHICRSIFVSQ